MEERQAAFMRKLWWKYYREAVGRRTENILEKEQLSFDHNLVYCWEIGSSKSGQFQEIGFYSNHYGRANTNLKAGVRGCQLCFSKTCSSYPSHCVTFGAAGPVWICQWRSLPHTPTGQLQDPPLSSFTQLSSAHGFLSFPTPYTPSCPCEKGSLHLRYSLASFCSIRRNVLGCLTAFRDQPAALSCLFRSSERFHCEALALAWCCPRGTWGWPGVHAHLFPQVDCEPPGEIVHRFLFAPFL